MADLVRRPENQTRAKSQEAVMNSNISYRRGSLKTEEELDHCVGRRGQFLPHVREAAGPRVQWSSGTVEEIHTDGGLQRVWKHQDQSHFLPEKQRCSEKSGYRKLKAKTCKGLRRWRRVVPGLLAFAVRERTRACI